MTPENLSQQFLRTGEVPLFASAHELVHGTTLGDMTTDHMPPWANKNSPTDEHVLAGKETLLHFKFSESMLDERHSERVPSAGLGKKITEGGYDWKSPIVIGIDQNDSKNPITVLNGHHRIAVMYQHAPHEPIPITVARVTPRRDDPFKFKRA